MIDKSKNEIINAQLKIEYEKCTSSFLKEWERAFEKEVKNGHVEKVPDRINEFGIIDIDRYDAENGILVIGRETNGWSNKDYENGRLFRDWLEGITKNGLPKGEHVSKHPNMWYNLGRWLMLIENPETPIEQLCGEKDKAIKAIGKIAFTNINKVRGKNKIGKEYHTIASADISMELLKKEIEIINPKIILCCGTARYVLPVLTEFSGEIILMPHLEGVKSNIKILDMPHSGARMKTIEMLENLQEELKKLNGSNHT